MRSFIKENIKINKNVMNILNKGLIISFVIGIIGILLILIYNTYSVTYDYYYGGLILIKTTFKLSAALVGFGIMTNKLLK